MLKLLHKGSFICQWNTIKPWLYWVLKCLDKIWSIESIKIFTFKPTVNKNIGKIKILRLILSLLLILLNYSSIIIIELFSLCQSMHEQNLNFLKISAKRYLNISVQNFYWYSTDDYELIDSEEFSIITILPYYVPYWFSPSTQTLIWYWWVN